LNKKIIKAPEITISYNPRLTHKPTIVYSIDAYVLFLDYFPKNTIQLQERVAVMYLNHTQKVLGIYLLSVGGMTSTIADIRLIFSVALKTASTGIMIAHNHPSSSLKPSQTDIEFTNRIKEAGRLLDIKLLDHFIIISADKKYFSFSDKGLI
jgi:DNA repair protein RadC